MKEAAGENLLRARWFAVDDDTIGGAAVANVDRPVSAHDYRNGDVAVAGIISHAIAEHIANLHNWDLKRGMPYQGVLRAGEVFDLGAALGVYWPDVHPCRTADTDQWAVFTVDGGLSIVHAPRPRNDMSMTNSLGLIPGMRA